VTAAGGRCTEKVTRVLEDTYKGAVAVGLDSVGGVPRRIGPMKVDAARIAIPRSGRTFDPGRFMPNSVREQYEDPEALQWCFDEKQRIPAAKFHATPANRRELLAKMDAAGMLEAEYARNVPRAPNGQSIASGAFAVPKDAGLDRLITNRIPANFLEESVGASADLFPHASCFCELHLSNNQELDCSAIDLPDFYHTCEVSRKRAERTQLGRPLPLGEVAELDCVRRLRAREGPPQASDSVALLQATLPMGDRNATDFAEVGHLGLLRSAGAARPEHLVTYRSPFPRSNVVQTVMIDDNIVLGKRRRRRGGARTPAPGAAEVVQRSVDAYASVGLAPKPSKTTLHASSITGLGARIDGRCGWVAAKPEHLVVAFATLGSCIENGGATHEAAALGTALLTHILLMRRDALCLVDRLFAWVHALGKGGGTFGRMPAAVADEIQVLAFLAPLLGTDLRVRYHPELVCSDARGGGCPQGGVCRTPINPTIAADLYRLRIRRGGAAYLDDATMVELNRLRAYFSDAGIPGGLVDLALSTPDPIDELLTPTRNWVGDLAEALDWRGKAFGFPLPAREHINLSEYRAFRVAIRRLIKEGVCSARVTLLTDSNVVLGATAKGRSKSVKLRRLQQAHVAELLFFNLYVGALPISTHRNPADDPSRSAPVRAPSEEPEDWATRYLRGDLEAIDRRLPALRHERWLPRVGSPPSPVYDRKAEWSLSHDDWAHRSRGQRGLLLGAEYSSDENADGPEANMRAPREARVASAPADIAERDAEPRRVPARRGSRQRDPTVNLLTGGVGPLRRAALDTLLADFVEEGRASGADYQLLLDGGDVAPLVAALRWAGQVWYNRGRPRHHFVELVNAVWHHRPEWRHMLSGAWGVAKEWEFYEPVKHHAPLPADLARAIVVVALLAGEFRFAASVAVGFAAGLRPGEIVSLTRRSLLFDDSAELLYVILSAETSFFFF